MGCDHARGKCAKSSHIWSTVRLSRLGCLSSVVWFACSTSVSCLCITALHVHDQLSSPPVGILVSNIPFQSVRILTSLSSTPRLLKSFLFPGAYRTGVRL